MSYGENPGCVLSFDSTLAWDRDEDFGHEFAGVDRVVSIIATGNDAGKVRLAADNDVVLGKLIDVHQDGTASVLVSGEPLIFRKSSAALALNSQVLGAGSGRIKAATTALTGRGVVIEVLDTAAGGRVKVLFGFGG